MNCEHCNNLRRAEGGLKIGGRVGLALIPACPCSEWPKLEEGTGIYSGPLPSNDVNETGGSFSGVFRFCSSLEGFVRPEIVEIELLNYDMSDWIVTCGCNVYAANPDDCTYSTIDGALGGSTWTNWAGTNGYVCFNAGDEGALYVLDFYIGGFRPDPIIEPPVWRMKYNFDRSGCT